MEHMIACDNHLAASCRKVEGPESAVIVRSLKNVPSMRNKKCQYKPCGTPAVWRLAYTKDSDAPS
jgi:hypothetical protein